MGDLRVILAEKSYLIREGIKKILNGYNNLYIEKEFVEMPLKADINNYDLLIINSNYFENSVRNFKIMFKENSSTNIIVISNEFDEESSNYFENYITVSDSKDSIEQKINSILSKKSIKLETISNEELSLREKEIVKGVALGKTNKEIAENLFISAHTVITHRKNITKKLGIKTVSGLTVYAILNNIISIEEAK